MGSPAIFNGPRTKLLTSKGLLLQSGRTIDFDGEPNYVSLDGWTAVGDLTLSTTTTAAELPREYLYPSGIKIIADADTQSVADYVYKDFTLDDVDVGRVLQVRWDQKITGSYVAGDLAVVITTQADRTTALYTPSVTAIPASDGTFGATFVTSDSTATLSIVIRATTDMATSAGIVISNVVVGPGTLVQGPAVGDWVSYTPTGSWSNNTAYTGFYRRVGGNAEFHIRAALSGTPNSATFTVNLPTGITINTAVIPTTGSRRSIVGSALIFDNGLGSDGNTIGSVYVSSSSAVGVTSLASTGAGGSYVTQAFPVAFGDLGNLDLVFTVPILEWSSGVYLGSGADGTSVLDWTSFTPTGGWTGSVSYTGKYRRVGDSAEFDILVETSGAPTGADLTINLPVTIDTAKITSTTANKTCLGVGSAGDGGVRVYPVVVDYNTSTSVVLYCAETTGSTSAAVQNDNPFTFGNGDYVGVRFTVPVSTWTSADYLGKMLVGFQTATSAKPGLVKVSDGTYTVTNVVTDRSYDANATSDAEIADVLGTLIADLQAAGIIK